MKKRIRLGAVLLLCVAVLFSGTQYLLAATIGSQPAKSSSSQPSAELAAAQAISTITGVAISPLLGVGAVGAYKWWNTPSEQRKGLPWFAHPGFWIPALILVAFITLKDVLGTAAPTALKKPFDAAELVENKISGLIAAGLFVPLIISIFPGASDAESQSQLAAFGFAAISGGSFLNYLLVPFALVAFALVWLASHAINVLILISPFTTVDAALKAARLFLLSLVTATSFANPYVAAAMCIIIIILSYFLAGWSFRLSVFGTLYIWDLLTFRRRRFQPGAETNWMFTARPMHDAPVRTYGRLCHTPAGTLSFEYRPWLFLGKRQFELPAGNFFVGRGVFYSEVSREDAEQIQTCFLLPPRYSTHEEGLARVYKMSGGVRDVGLLKGFKALWSWIRGDEPDHRAPSATPSPAT